MEESFDLSAFSLAASQRVRPVRLMLAVGLALCSIIAVGIAVFNLVRGTLFQNLAATFGAAYIGLAVILVVFAWVLYLTGRGAIRLEVDSKQIRLRWPSGKIEFWRWDDPRIRVDLYYYSSDPLVANPQYRDLRLPNRPKTVISPVAFETVIRLAKENGLRLTTRSPSAAWYGACQRTEIRGVPHPA